jgi:hypothetical protein
MNKYRSGGKTTPKAKVAAKPKAKMAAKPKAKVAAKPKKAYQSGGVAKAKPKAAPKAKKDTLGPLTEREKFLIQQAREADMDRKMQEAAARQKQNRLKPKGYAVGGGIGRMGRFDPSMNRQPPRQRPQPSMDVQPIQPMPSSQPMASQPMASRPMASPQPMPSSRPMPSSQPMDRMARPEKTSRRTRRPRLR